MTPKRVAAGIYKRNGGYYHRPIIRGRPTWRRLASLTLASAKIESAKLKSDQALSKLGLARDPFKHSGNIALILKHYDAHDCPDRRKRPRQGKSLMEERRRLGILLRLLNNLASPDLKQPDLDRYAESRFKEVQASRKRPGRRTVDMEIQTLSNALNYGVRCGLIPSNPIRDNRPNFWGSEDARHCRDCTPRSGEELHKHAAFFFRNPISEVLGWQLLFTALTGLRTNEVLKLRWDAKSRFDPGYQDGQSIWLARSKDGIKPFLELSTILQEYLSALHNWHRKRFPSSPWFFPSPFDPTHPVDSHALNRALKRSSKEVCDGQPRTPHGLRAFYVTCRRSEGASDPQIAYEIGDKTAALISSTYGSIPDNWIGGKEWSFLPTKGKPAWQPWMLKKTRKPVSGTVSGAIVSP